MVLKKLMVMNTVQSWIYAGINRKTYSCMWTEALSGGGGGGSYFPSLKLRYGRFAFWGVGHVPVGT